MLEKNEQAFGIARSLEKDKNVKHLASQIEVFPCDIQNSTELKKVLAKVQPERIYHLASLTFVPEVAKEGAAAFETNVLGTMNLMQAIQELPVKPRVLFVGSAEVYGLVAGDVASIDEENPLQPASLYGVSKAAAELLARSYVNQEGAGVISVRPFNHIGPRQDSRFACSSFARQIALIEKGAQPIIKTGNLDSLRDFMDVRDTVRAYHAVMQEGRPGEVFNVCSGKSVSVRSVLETLLSFSEMRIKLETDPKLFRQAKPGVFCGDYSRLHQRTGWRPEIPLERTLQDMLHYWRQNI